MKWVFRTALFVGLTGTLIPPLSLGQDQGSGKAEKTKQGTAPKPITINDQLTNADNFDRLRTNSHHKVHAVEMVPGYRYDIHMTAKFDTYLRLEDEKGKQIAQDDDGGGGLNSRIIFTPTAKGKYRIIATTFGGGVTGFYKITVVATKLAGGGPQPGKVLELKNGFLAVQGALANSDLPDKMRNTYHKVYVVKMQEGKTYTISMASRAFDTYLRLESPSGAPLAQDDDGGGGLNSRIVFAAPKAGTYRIIATSFARDTGAFTLTVSEK